MTSELTIRFKLIDDVQNMDGEFEPTNPDMFIDWNHHTAFENFEETITELAAVPTSSVST